MTAGDFVTGKDIINPYISIRKNGKGVFLNTSTFGDCQEELIHPLDEKRKTSKELYEVIAIVGEYNFDASFQLKIPGLQTVSIVRPPRSEIFLGYLERKTLEENKLHKILMYLNGKNPKI